MTGEGPRTRRERHPGHDEHEQPQIEWHLFEINLGHGPDPGDSAHNGAPREGPDDTPVDVLNPQKDAARVGGELHGRVHRDNGGRRDKTGHDGNEQNPASKTDGGGERRGQERDHYKKDGLHL